MKCSLESPELLHHCQRMSRRFVLFSVVASAFVFTITAALPFGFLNSSIPVSFGERLSIALRLESAALLFVVFAILRVAILRGTDGKGVMGQREGTAPETEIAIRVLNNTTEQFLLSFPSHLVLSLLLPDDKLAVLLGFVSLWLTARAMFMIGYKVDHPMGRELGFQLTFVPTIIVIVYNCVFGLLLWTY